MKSSNYLNHKTRIIATIGPATESKTKIKELIQAGVTVFRLNMSHGDHETHRQSFLRIRQIAQDLNRHIPIFCDLCGPKIRVGKIKNGSMTLVSGTNVMVTTRQVIGEDGVIPSQYAKLHSDVKIDDRVLMDDGKLELKVKAIENQDITCEVVYGGDLSDHKGINLPDTDVSTSALTVADKRDVKFAIEMGADLLALSFVRCAGDVQELKAYIKHQNSDEIPIISKIEKPEALDNIDEILNESYAIMIARGDLGVEIPAAQVPIVQKELIDKARCEHKPVIVATQMLESMISSARPTRAEVGDVTNAAFNGTDAVMLSGETSVGKFPIQAVRYMSEVLFTAEAWQIKNNFLGQMPAAYFVDHKASKRTVISNAAVNISRELSLLALLLPTRSGSTAATVSAYRPESLCIGVSASEKVCRLLSLHWGLVPVNIEEQDVHDWSNMARVVSKKLHMSLENRSICVLSGFSDDKSSNEPVLKLLGF